MLINIYLNHCYGFCYGMGFFNILWKWNIGHLSSRPKEISIEYQCKKISIKYQCKVPSLVAQMVKNPPAMRETWVWSLGWEDSLEEGSSILAWRITMERGTWRALVHVDYKKWDTTEWLSTAWHRIRITLCVTCLVFIVTCLLQGVFNNAKGLELKKTLWV